MDDQPIWMRTRAGPILSVPYPLKINDLPALVYRRHTGRQFAEMVIDQFDEMLEQSRKYPLVLRGVGAPLHYRPAVPPARFPRRNPPHRSPPRSAVDHHTRRDRTLLRRLAERHDPRVGVAHGGRGRDAGSQSAEYREISEAVQDSNAKIATFASYLPA